MEGLLVALREGVERWVVAGGTVVVRVWVTKHTEAFKLKGKK